MNAWEERHLNEIKRLKEQLFEVKNTQNFMCNQYNKLLQDYDNSSSINKIQEDEIKT